MKKIVLLVLASAAVFVSCKKETATAETNHKVQVDKKEVANAQTTTMKIDGMTCAMGCAKTIENKLAGLEGVQKATVDFDKKMATIEYDPAIQTPEKLSTTIEEVADGKTYKVSDVKNL